MEHGGKKINSSLLIPDAKRSSTTVRSISSFVNVHTCMYTHTHTHTCADTHTHTHVQTHTHTHTHTHTNKHTLTHTGGDTVSESIDIYLRASVHT